MIQQYYTTQQIAPLAGVRVDIIREDIKRGRLAAAWWGGRWCVARDDVDAYLAWRNRRHTRCRNGHDLSEPGSVTVYGQQKFRRCKLCAKFARMRWQARDEGEEPQFYLAERNPEPFQTLAAQTRALPTCQRLDAAIRFWNVLTARTSETT